MSKVRKRSKLYKLNPACGICDEAITEEQLLNTRYITIDHVIPIKLGGSNELSNLQLAHIKCNSIKSHRMPDDPEIRNHPKWYKRLTEPPTQSKEERI